MLSATLKLGMPQLQEMKKRSITYYIPTLTTIGLLEKTRTK